MKAFVLKFPRSIDHGHGALRHRHNGYTPHNIGGQEPGTVEGAMDPRAFICEARAKSSMRTLWMRLFYCSIYPTSAGLLLCAFD